jgi:hypothetical protein
MTRKNHSPSLIILKKKNFKRGFKKIRKVLEYEVYYSKALKNGVF